MSGNSEYRDSLDQGADNAARLGQEAAKRIINHRNGGRGNARRQDSSDTGHKNDNESNPAHNDDVNKNKHNPTGDETGSMDPDTELDANPSGAHRNMGGINNSDMGFDSGASRDSSVMNENGAKGQGNNNDNTGGNNAASADANPSGSGNGTEQGAANTGSNAAGANAAEKATETGANAANASNAANAANTANAIGGAGGTAGAAGAGASSAAGAAGGASAGSVGCLVVLVILALFFFVSLISLLCGVITYSDESVLASTTTSSNTGVTITGSAVNVREGAGVDKNKIGLVYRGGVYTYLGEGRDNSGRVWYKIQYTSSTAGWVTSEYSTKSSTGGNRMVELANSVLVYLADDYADAVSSAKNDVQGLSSVYGGKIPLAGTNQMGGPKGVSYAGIRCYEYYIDDGGVTASFESENGSMEVDVPYVLAAFSVYLEKNNDIIDLSTASSDEVWAVIEDMLDEIFVGSHNFSRSAVSYTYQVKDPENEDETISKTGYYYTYSIQKETVETLLYTYFQGELTDADWELVETKSIFIAQLLYELGGLCYNSTFESGDTMMEGDGSTVIVDDSGIGRFAWPTPSCKSVNSPFGYRYHPISGSYKLHKGVDIPAARGSTVVAAADGTVIKTFKSCSHNYASSCGCGGGYGNYVYIQHADGYVTRYAHLTSVNVKVGASVVRGQMIATVGSTGNSTGAHLHYEVRKNGTPVDPMGFY